MSAKRRLLLIIPEVILGISLLFGFPVSGWLGIALGVALLLTAVWTLLIHWN